MGPILTLDWLHVLVLLGAVHGVFLTIALASRRPRRAASGLLAAAMLGFSVGMATTAYHAAHLETAYPHFFGLAFPLPFLYGPLVYLYVVAAADPSWRPQRRHALHLVPFLATVLAGLPIYLSSGAEKLAFHHRLLAGDLPLLVQVADPLKYVSGVAYAGATLVFLRRHRGHASLRWQTWLGAAAAGIWLLAIVCSVLDATGLVARADDYVSLAVAILVYAIGYLGLQQPEAFRHEPEAAAPEAARYERSGLTDVEARRLKDELLAVMDRDQPWRDSELTLGQLAERLGATPHKVSEVLNAQVGESFHDFVNGYRVREVQRRIAAGEAATLKMLSLALEAGFASKSTFNQVFKKHTRQTPSDYRSARQGPDPA